MISRTTGGRSAHGMQAVAAASGGSAPTSIFKFKFKGGLNRTTAATGT